MSFINISKEVINKVFTENGDKAFATTGSYCLDYFSLVGGMRNNLRDALNLFMKSYYEDPIMTIKILFYVRDIRSGLGERNLFRYTFNALANMYPDVARQLIEFIPEYGRYDDLLVCLDSTLKKDVIRFFKDQLDEDIKNKKEGKSISLLAKWLPSINTSNPDARKLATKLAEGFCMKKEDYRKTLSFLRKGMIIENNLREVDYTFDYEKVPSCAFFKYQNAFNNHDRLRYKEFIESAKQGKTKINTNTLYPYEIIRKLEKNVDKKEAASLDAIWKNFDRTNINSKTIVVRDGSGSMYDYEPVSAISVATSLAILFAEQLTGEFKDTFITFSSRPRIVKIKGETIEEKFKYIRKFSDCSTTNIKKVYDLILDTYKHPSFNKDDALDRVVIISDMEFNSLGNKSKSTFEYFKEKFEELGFRMPEIVFWNVRARNVHYPTINENGVKLISGSSAKVINMVTNNITTDAYQFMLECLKKYSCFDEIRIS